MTRVGLKLQALIKLLRSLAAPRLWHALTQGTTASFEHRAALRDLGLRTVVDVGANRGQFSLLAAMLFPEARIHAFEPLTDPSRRFRRVHRRNTNVVHYQAAIGATVGEREMYVTSDDDSSSLLPMTERQQRLYGTKTIDREAITVQRLDAYLRPVDLVAPALLKIDVQGYELEALRGCEALLPHFAYLYVECSFVELYAGQALAAEVLGYLASRGISLGGIYNCAYDSTGRAIQADLLLRNQAVQDHAGSGGPKG